MSGSYSSIGGNTAQIEYIQIYGISEREKQHNHI